MNIPNHLYWDDTIDPPSGLSIEKGHMFRDSLDRVCIPPERFLEIEDEEDIERGYMLTNAEFETLRYEDPNIRKLRDCQVKYFSVSTFTYETFQKNFIFKS